MGHLSTHVLDTMHGCPAAGKTGTTSDYKDAWFVGYTPDMAAAVWVGDPRGGQKYPMKNITINGRYFTQAFGSLLPGPIWRDSLKGALEGTPATPWDLNTLNGIHAGGYGDKITASKDTCAGLEEPDLTACKTAKAEKKGLADGTLIIDPVTGAVIPNPTPPVIAPTATPSASPTATTTP